MKKPSLQELVFIGLAVAIGVVLNQILAVEIPPAAPIIKFGLGYLTLILVGAFYGPVYGGFAGLALDLIGYFLFAAAKGIPFFPGFTFNAMLYGVFPGFFFRGAKQSVRLHGILNLVILGLFLANLSVYVFNIDFVLSRTLTEAQKTILVAIAVPSVIALGGFNVFLWKKRTEATYHPIRVLSIVLFLYLLVSIFLTPLWVTIMSLDEQGVAAVPYLAQIPLRIVKMPIEVIAYTLLLTPLLSRLNRFANKIEE